MHILLALVLLISPPQSSESLAKAVLLSDQTRMRRVHIVRPDLLQYPVAYDLYA